MSQQISQSLPDTLSPSLVKVEEIKEIWGRLIPRRTYLLTIDLSDDVYTLGRKEQCSIHITGKNMSPNLLGIISKEHFIISRDSSYIPYIKDLSRNGTFLNGILIGKNNMSTLCTEDVISVGNVNIEVYQFRDELQSPTEYGRKYKDSRILGRGAFGEVYLSYLRETCHRYAVKKIQKAYLTYGIIKSNDDKIENEIKILKALKHPCVILLKEIIYGDDMVHIILEYMEGGELHKRILKKRFLSEDNTKLFFYQMTLALQYLHKQGITHRDLKPENILLATHDDDTLVKVTDFGLSKIIDEGSVLKSLCGTPMFVAPEILRNNDTYTSQVDIWSLGVILFYCLSGHSPFVYDDNSLKSLFRQIQRAEYTIPQQLACTLSPEALEMIDRTLQVDPNKRIAVEDILQHKWMKDENVQKVFKELLMKIQ